MLMVGKKIEIIMNNILDNIASQNQNSQMSAMAIMSNVINAKTAIDLICKISINSGLGNPAKKQDMVWTVEALSVAYTYSYVELDELYAVSKDILITMTNPIAAKLEYRDDLRLAIYDLHIAVQKLYSNAFSLKCQSQQEIVSI